MGFKQAKALGIWPGDIANDIAKGFIGSRLTSWDKMTTPLIGKSGKVSKSKLSKIRKSKCKCVKGKWAQRDGKKAKRSMGKCIKKGKGKSMKNKRGKLAEDKLSARKM